MGFVNSNNYWKQQGWSPPMGHTPQEDLQASSAKLVYSQVLQVLA